MRIAANPTRCIGAGQCVLTVPAVFDQDEDGTAVVLADEPDAEHHGLVKEAVYLCPASALSIIND